MTDGRGADVCVDAVGMEADRSFLDKVEGRRARRARHDRRAAAPASAPCAAAASSRVVGVYGTPTTTSRSAQMFDKGIRLQRRSGARAQLHRRADRSSSQHGKVVLDDIITHTLPLSEAPHAYEIFNKKQDNCVKVVLKPGLQATAST